MSDLPVSPDAKITVERRQKIVLIGINRPPRFNRIDPEAFYGVAKAYYDFDTEPTLRAAVLVGHGDNKDATLKMGIDIANRIAACGPIGIKATLKVAHRGINYSADSGRSGKPASCFSRPISDRVSLASRAGHFRHDLSHLHRLARRHFMNSDDDLIIRRASCALKKLPEAFYQSAFVLH
jgi:hypothetical protein